MGLHLDFTDELRSLSDTLYFWIEKFNIIKASILSLINIYNSVRFSNKITVSLIEKIILKFICQNKPGNILKERLIRITPI